MKILVIDDDPAICQLLKSNLEKEFYAVDISMDAERGIFLGRSSGYDLIILDNVLPGKNGKEVCRKIREKKKGVKIMMLSGLSDVSIKTDLLDLGADDYMTKPFSFSELQARIKALLRRPYAVAEEKIKIGSLVIDMGKYEVRKKGKELALTRKEFMLLEFLARNAGRAMSQVEIMEHVWDMELDLFSNTLKSHVRNLRRKIDGGRKDGFIKTVNGRGYKLDAN